MQPEIAQHPFFGPVTPQEWKLVFHPPGGRPKVTYAAHFLHEPTHEDYEGLLPRLPDFERFCRHLDVNDRLMQDHFRSWPRTAGACELIGIFIDGDEHLQRRNWDELRAQLPDWPIPLHGLVLQYRALDEEAWDYAGIHCYPPVFCAYFDEAAGTFSGVEETVERGMRSLPESIVRSRFEDAYYRHPYFGRRKLQAPWFSASISRLGTATVGSRKVPLELYVDKRTMSGFEPEQLDPFVPLAESLTALDATVRAGFPSSKREDWLALRYAPENHARLARALDSVFPGVTAADQVSPERFAAALTLRRACFSLSPDGSDGADLTLDYHLLPQRLDNYLFAASFWLDGTLQDIAVES